VYISILKSTFFFCLSSQINSYKKNYHNINGENNFSIKYYEKSYLCVASLARPAAARRRQIWFHEAFSPHLHFCVTGCGAAESASHLFISCSTFGSLWPLVRSWIGFSAVDAHTLSDHFVQFTYSAGGLRARRSFLQLVWLACVWVIWNERNLSLQKFDKLCAPAPG
jgi:hypothetical protein